ncbi:obg family GTPase CgtA [Radiomyces spectabilis]|uniref:obg family GTPase CgtA n=1 Tax=Radiomyces spectabilis TaxID=64574 RepID=UPI00221F9A66|nr:obg family GTPase CgtA [Radiomyces spectabilis]KAI8379611.1 obg family GTPase CgtA [Radiomyces spectabilis]
MLTKVLSQPYVIRSCSKTTWQRVSWQCIATRWFTSDPSDPATRARSPASIEYKLRGKGRQFVDFVRIVARGGDGGDGCVSFHREKYLAKGPPNGGNGGRGGSVILRASADESTLRHLGHVASAKRGQNGMGGGRHGTMGENLVINVPVGTIVREVTMEKRRTDEDEEEESDEDALERQREARWVYFPRTEQPQPVAGRVDFFKQAERLMDEEDRYLRWRERTEKVAHIEADLTEPGQELIVCRGGAGGYGNPHFLTTENRSPKWATRGRKGETRSLELELKTIADIGLVGLPNAGKSSLLGAISNAHPKQAAYAFTTLHPFVGTVDYADQYQLTVADIPGLIRGAHRNIGLGHAFLRHVERAKLLVYVVDLSGPAPWEDVKTLQYELEAYRPGLTKRQSLIVANKADLVQTAKDNLFRLQAEANDIPIIPVSARYEKNILKLTSILRKNVERIRAEEKQKKELEQSQKWDA